MRLLLLSLVIAASAQTGPATLHDAFNAQQTYEYNARVASFGERWPGKPGHAKTEAFIKEILKKDGAVIEGDDFTATTPQGPVPVHNIIGKFSVNGDPNQPIFILAGHYDTLRKPGFIGANDGGSSTAILLGFADALAKKKTKMQIWLLFTDLEEGTFVDNDGLYGSRHLAQKLKANGTVPRIRGFFLLDMIGDKDLGVARETQSSRKLQDVISRAAMQLGYSRYFFPYEMSITDDHVKFLNVSIPAVQ